MVKLFREYQSFANIGSAGVIAIGNFDGIHKGHHKVIETAKLQAKSLNTSFSVMTFHPHPMHYFGCGSVQINKMIYRVRDKITGLSDFEPDYILLQRFSDNICHMDAKDFVSDVIVKYMKAKLVVVGYDFMFGRDRKGSAESLKSMSVYYGFDVIIVPKVLVNDNLCSSTNIRKLLSVGEIALANTSLAKKYTIEGKVIKGNQNGRKFGFPTANISLPNVAIAYGAYLATVTLDSGEVHKAVANYGIRPTIDDVATEILEVHILSDNNFDLYNKKIKVQLDEFIRPERKFSSIQELKEQIKNDVDYAKTRSSI